MNIKTMTAALLLTAAAGASAQTIIFEEDFNGDYTDNFPTLLDLDNQPSLANFSSLFMDSNGVTRPWWRLRDSGSSPDGFLGSHSAYLTPGMSNDWVVSRPIEIPTTGFKLHFGAQSFVMRVEGDRVSNLWVYITEREPSKDWTPTYDETVAYIERVPEGRFADAIENDFTDYEAALDKWAGKTVYLSFANFNTDKDIVLIDNVRIERLDKVALEAASARYVEKGKFTVDATLKCTAENDLGAYTLIFDPGTGAEPQEIAGTGIASGNSRELSFEADIDADVTANWSLTFKTDGEEDVVRTGVVSGLGFIPYHRVLLEETTGAWCGNCPMGIYAIEQMTESEEMKDYVIPVSVHINGSPTDYMVDDNYSYMLGVTAAPAVRIDRGTTVKYFDTQYDLKPELDLTETRSMAYQVKARHEETTLLDIDLDASFIIEGSDTTAIEATVKLRPAMTLNGAPYRVGFALTENNVMPAYDRFWNQHNYLSGVTALEGGAGGFVDMPEEIPGWRFQDVARGVYDFHGLDEIVMPETLKMGEDYSFTARIAIPDKSVTLNGDVTAAHPIVAGNLSVVAFVLDSDDTFAAVNSAHYPMTELAAMRPTIAEQLARINEELKAGIGSVAAADSNAPAEYYTIDGVRVNHPEAGRIYIVRRGDKVNKQIL